MRRRGGSSDPKYPAPSTGSQLGSSSACSGGSSPDTLLSAPQSWGTTPGQTHTTSRCSPGDGARYSWSWQSAVFPGLTRSVTLLPVTRQPPDHQTITQLILFGSQFYLPFFQEVKTESFQLLIFLKSNLTVIFHQNSQRDLIKIFKRRNAEFSMKFTSTFRVETTRRRQSGYKVQPQANLTRY